MKLKPRGKKLAIYQNMAFVGAIGLPITFCLGWPALFWLCVACLVVAISRIVGIGIDANTDKYGLWGHHCGVDTLVEYEPTDKEYFVNEKV